jgi:hypothetical protein
MALMGGRGLKSKVGLALLGALVVGGGGTALAMSGAHLPLLSSQLAPASSTGDSHDRASATHAGDRDDQDDRACGTPGASASPTAHADDTEDAHGTPSATRTAGGDDHEGSGSEKETDCEGSGESHEGTPGPEPTEQPEGTHTPEATPTGGHGGD